MYYSFFNIYIMFELGKVKRNTEVQVQKSSKTNLEISYS